MRIGHEDNFLSIEAVSLDGGYAAVKMEAVASTSGRRFTAFHDSLMIDSSDEVIQRLDDFDALISRQLEIRLSEAGWLRLERERRGSITVRYRISGWKAAAAMEGEVPVDGEFAGSFCRELRALLRGQR